MTRGKMGLVRNPVAGRRPVRHAERDFRLKHRYDQPGTFTIVLTVLDNDGGSSGTMTSVFVQHGHT